MLSTFVPHLETELEEKAFTYDADSRGYEAVGSMKLHIKLQNIHLLTSETRLHG